MSLAWHIARKDLVRLSWPAVTWIALQVATIFLAWTLRDEVFGHDRNDVRWGTHFATIVMAGLMSYLLAGMMLQEDALAESRAFWRTRPISRARLMLGKLLVVAVLFWLTPIAIKLPWWLLNHYGPREIGWAALESAIMSVALTSPAFLFASVTKDASDFYRWTFGALVLGVLILVLLAAGFREGLGRMQWRWMFAGAALLSAVGACVQIATRRRWLTLMLVGAGLPVIVGVCAVGNRRVDPIAASSDVLVREVRLAARGAEPPALEVAVVPAKAETAVFATLTNVRGTVRARGEEHAVNWQAPEQRPAALLEWIVHHGTFGGAIPASAPLAMTPDQARRMTAGAATAMLSVEGEIWKAEDAIELPLRIDAKRWQGSRRWWITDVHRREERHTRLIRFTGAAAVSVTSGRTGRSEALQIKVNEVVSLLAVDGAEIVVENSGVPEGVEEFHLLVNRPRNEIISLPRAPISSTRSATVGINETWLSLADAKMSDEAFTAWLAEASLVKVVLRRLGRFTRVVESTVEGKAP